MEFPWRTGVGTVSPLGWLVAFVLGLTCGLVVWVNGTIVGENQVLTRAAYANHAEYVVCQAKVMRLEIKGRVKR